MGEDETDGCPSVTRRRALAAVGASAATAITGCIDQAGIGDGAATTTSGSDGATIGLSTADSGTYLGIGQEERRGFELAVRHLNEGGGLVDEGVFPSLGGDGVLGRTVETATYDTGSDPQQTQQRLGSDLADGDLSMFCGGITGTVVEGLRSLAAEHRTPYFPGTSLLQSLTGSDCSQYVFHEQFSSKAALRALGPTLVEEFGESAVYQQLYVDAPEGDELVDVVDAYFTDNADDWVTQGTIQHRRGTTNMDRVLERVRSIEPDVLFCHLFGLDAVNLLDQAADQLPDGTALVFPWLNQAVGNSVNGDVAGVYATTTWDPGFSSWRSKTFAESYRRAYDAEGVRSQVATGPAHLTYVQVLTYAAAAQAARSLEPDAVVAELEGLSYDVGLGDETLQACNHQATRPVPVVRGRERPTDSESWFDVLSVENGAVATCDEPPASNCSL